jgi:hypothetical protein
MAMGSNVDSILDSIRREREIEQGLLDLGWHRVSHVGIRGDFEDIAWWLDDGNILGEHRYVLSGHMFEREEDAVLFILTWK